MKNQAQSKTLKCRQLQFLFGALRVKAFFSCIRTMGGFQNNSEIFFLISLEYNFGLSEWNRVKKKCGKLFLLPLFIWSTELYNTF